MGNGALAEEILMAMGHALVEPKPSDKSLAIAAMCRNNKLEPGWWRKALELLLEKPSPEVSIEAYDAVIACMVDECQWKEALRLLREMERGSSTKDKRKPTHPRPAVSTYREVCECCVAANRAEQAVQVLTSMIDQQLKPTVYTFELVISSLAKKLQWRRAVQLLDLMGELGVQKTVLLYNTIISSCARAKEVGMAKNLLRR
jgi:pentatricopeptide repeat protein